LLDDDPRDGTLFNQLLHLIEDLFALDLDPLELRL
jgi:hypothetical protein